MTPSEILSAAINRQKDMTSQEKDYAIFFGKEHDLLLALPHTEKLTKNFKIYFSKKQSRYNIITIYSGEHVYKILFNDRQLLFNEKGYHCIMGRYAHQKGLHKQLLYRLAYIAFYGDPLPGYHIHHIDRDKHNNSMDNLVALTEAEHEAVHSHSVSPGRNLFNAPKRLSLLSELDSERAVERERPEKEEEGILYQVEEQISQSVEQLLENSPTKRNLRELVSRVVQTGEMETTLQYLCRMYLTLEDSLPRHSKEN